MIGNQLKEELKKNGITHEQAADLLGIARTTLNVWFGKPSFTEAMLHKVRTKLNIDLLQIERNSLAYSSDAKEISKEFLQEKIKNLEKQVALFEDIKQRDERFIEVLRSEIELLKRENADLQQLAQTSHVG